MDAKRKIAVGLVALALLAACAKSGADATSASNGTTSPSPSVQTEQWLTVASAREGSATGDSLTLSSLEPTIVAFADRPYRDSYSVPADRYFKEWPQYFTDDPPNAALTWDTPEGPAHLIIELGGVPSLTNGDITFPAVTPIDADALPSGILESPQLFIDGVHPCPDPTDDCNNGGYQN